MEIDVIIPSKSNAILKPMIENCISSLRESEPNLNWNVILIESGEKIDCGQNITIDYDKSDFNYNHALNLGLSHAKNEWIILANNDLIFHKDFMFEILLAHAERPDILSFSPWNAMHNWHNFYFPKPKKIIEGYRICAELVGWCIIVKREVFEKIELKEHVNFWYSDNVYADELIKSGIKHALISTSKVDHITSQTKIVSNKEAKEAFSLYNREKSQ